MSKRVCRNGDPNVTSIRPHTTHSLYCECSHTKTAKELAEIISEVRILMSRLEKLAFKLDTE